MKRHLLFSGLLTFLFCFTIGSLQAQCKKSKSSCTKNKTVKTDSTKKTTCNKTKSYTSCTYRKSACKKDRYNDDFYYEDDYLMVLGGATSDFDNNFNVTTGLEYEKRLNRTLGIGALAEVNISDSPSVLTGIPVSFHLTRNIRLITAPVMLTQKVSASDTKLPTTTAENTWNNSFGARAGLSYMINANGFIIAPTIRADYLDEKVRPGFGLNIGLGF
jgi:hypothetical protein